MNQSNITIRKLSTHEIRDVYRKYLRNDFPRNERRPLLYMIRMRRRQQYVCYGMFRDGRIICYAFFIMLTLKGQRCCLFDYFAVIPQLRGSGVGTWFITHFEEYIRHMDLIILETEDPDTAKNQEEKAVMENRLAFYLKNGLLDTGILVKTFGVPYRILELPLSRKKSETTREEICSAYEAFYRITLPEKVFHKYVRFMG